jgi:hypothetical protein
MDNNWISIKEKYPPLREVVETKVEKDGKEYNVQPMKRDGLAGRLWFFPDGSMYVYYEPTHWRPLSNIQKDPARQ